MELTFGPQDHVNTQDQSAKGAKCEIQASGPGGSRHGDFKLAHTGPLRSQKTCRTRVGCANVPQPNQGVFRPYVLKATISVGIHSYLRNCSSGGSDVPGETKVYPKLR